MHSCVVARVVAQPNWNDDKDSRVVLPLVVKDSVEPAAAVAVNAAAGEGT